MEGILRRVRAAYAPGPPGQDGRLQEEGLLGEEGAQGNYGFIAGNIDGIE